MLEQPRTCAFTGHRPQKLSFGYNETDMRCIRLKRELRAQIVSSINDDNVEAFITGMAQGVDIWAAETVLELRESYPHITLEAALPCETQTRNWPQDQLERYRRILNAADKVTYVQRPHSKDCFHKRDRYMVDRSDQVIAVWDGTRSGTGYTVDYAQELGKPIVIIDPDTARVRTL